LRWNVIHHWSSAPFENGCARLVAQRTTVAQWRYLFKNLEDSKNMFLIKIFLGLNGRPEKLPDVCYSWWVVSSLSIIGRTEWLDKSQLKKFIMACQDTETGGFSDRPSDMPDPFHTLFGLAGLSLLGESSLKAVNPVFCMPQYVIDRLKISPQILS